jgi:very-short-patch-repair endonuclease
MTDAERRLWSVLRGRRCDDYKFRRQVPVGRYVADFICYEHRLIVEVDGSQHDESARDKTRDAWLASQGFRLLRLWNRDVLLDTDGALLSILAALQELPHPPRSRSAPSPARGEGRRTDS